MKKVAIDLTWVRHNKVGGTESCIRNLLDGLAELNCKDIKMVLLLTKDNSDSFQQYGDVSCFELCTCDVKSARQIDRVIWQNTHMGKYLKSMGVYLCLEPVYGKPFFGTNGIKFFTTIHDLQAKHYPQYFSKGRVAWMKISWKNSVRTSEKVIAISNYVRQDILETFQVSSEKVQVIYDAIVMDTACCAPVSELQKYGVKPGEYYYSVSSLLPHKNLKTAVLSIAELKKRKSPAFMPLVVSGIGGNMRDELDRLIAENNVKDDIIFTSFVDNSERNMLYVNSRAFVFTSIFEGFGMPPIEAMLLGVPVLTTRCTSLYEVTSGLCNYVDDPLNPNEWAVRLEGELRIADKQKVKLLTDRFACREIASRYIELFRNHL